MRSFMMPSIQDAVAAEEGLAAAELLSSMKLNGLANWDGCADVAAGSSKPEELEMAPPRFLSGGNKGKPENPHTAGG